MDDEKKSESSWEEAEQVGPYQLKEQVPQDDYKRGELYRATHETSGAPTLVLKRAAEDEERAVPQPGVQVRITSASGYDSMEVEQTPWSVAPDRQSVESLVSTLEDVHEAVERMAHALSAAPEPRPRRPLGLVLASTAAVCALAFALMYLAPMSPPPSGPDSLAGTELAPPSHEVPTDTQIPATGNSSWGLEDGGSLAFAHPLPSKPYKGQRRPPCKPRVEVEINGGCWVPHKEKAPCPEDLYEYQGECYTVSMQPPSMPQSIGQ